MKFPSITAFKSLNDLQQNRYSSALDLPSKPEIVGKNPLLGNLINCPSEISGSLPGDSIFKTVYYIQHSSLSTVL